MPTPSDLRAYAHTLTENGYIVVTPAGSVVGHRRTVGSTRQAGDGQDHAGAFLANLADRLMLILRRAGRPMTLANIRQAHLETYGRPIARQTASTTLTAMLGDPSYSIHRELPLNGHRALWSYSNL